ncbi:MAG: hypothetical protein Q4G59_00950, partial [Planctomycetia bacterium]|nr:hypothetical protein [Planctomycetia bacterium]
MSILEQAGILLAMFLHYIREFIKWQVTTPKKMDLPPFCRIGDRLFNTINFELHVYVIFRDNFATIIDFFFFFDYNKKEELTKEILGAWTLNVYKYRFAFLFS